MNHDALHAQLGRFVLIFQAVEAAMVELIVQIVDADPKYLATLTTELEFNAKARALGVIYTRHAQIHGLSNEAPHPNFHKLMTRIQKLATRRNDLVHSFYNLLITVEPVLHEVNAQHALQANGRAPFAGLGVVWVDLFAKCRPWHQRIHSLEKFVTPCGLAVLLETHI